jgi:hypothetical protein
MGHTLSIDLGSVQPVRRIATQFEYATWYYQYLIETSMDEEKWEVFADRRENTRWGSPMIDRNDVNARYVRLTITGVQKPGIFGAIWNIKVYAEDRVGAYEKLADEGFHNFVSSQSIDDPGQAYRRTSTNSTEPLISVTAEGLAPDSETLKLANSGSLQGYFAPKRKAPVVKTIEGRSAIYFSGEDVLEASFSGPPELSGNSSYTVEAMVFNPEVAEAEALISWCGRGGPDGMTGQVGYGSHPSWGAVGHWGFADMGFAGKTPQAGQWHHIAVVFDGVIERVYVDGALCNQAAKMLLMHAGRPIYLGASEPGVEHYSGYLAWLKVWPYPRPAESFVAP